MTTSLKVLDVDTAFVVVVVDASSGYFLFRMVTLKVLNSIVLLGKSCVYVKRANMEDKLFGPPAPPPSSSSSSSAGKTPSRTKTKCPAPPGTEGRGSVVLNDLCVSNLRKPLGLDTHTHTHTQTNTHIHKHTQTHTYTAGVSSGVGEGFHSVLSVSYFTPG